MKPIKNGLLVCVGGSGRSWWLGIVEIVNIKES
jgi:hypothetical protein